MTPKNHALYESLLIEIKEEPTLPKRILFYFFKEKKTKEENKN